MEASLNFIDLSVANILFLLFVGFVGGLVSGFIGSGGAFVLTPGDDDHGCPRDCCGGFEYLSQVSQSTGRRFKTQ